MENVELKKDEVKFKDYRPTDEALNKEFRVEKVFNKYEKDKLEKLEIVLNSNTSFPVKLADNEIMLIMSNKGKFTPYAKMCVGKNEGSAYHYYGFDVFLDKEYFKRVFIMDKTERIVTRNLGLIVEVN
jgi:hypothetical protein